MNYGYAGICYIKSGDNDPEGFINDEIKDAVEAIEKEYGINLITEDYYMDKMIEMRDIIQQTNKYRLIGLGLVFGIPIGTVIGIATMIFGVQ